MTKIKITENMDLLKIYNDGDFEDFKEQCETFLKETYRLSWLRVYFKDKYYEDFAFSIHNNMVSYHNKMHFKKEDDKFIEYNEDDYVNKRKEIYNDKFFNELDSLSKKYRGRKNPHTTQESLRFNGINDEIGIEFYLKYINRINKRFSYINLKEDAINDANDELLNFIQSHTQDPYYIKKILSKRLSDKLLQYRLDTNLNIDEFSKQIGVTKEQIKDLEDGLVKPSLNTISAYANITHKSADDILKDLYLKKIPTGFEDESRLSFCYENKLI